jgi:NADP-dependent 3-hydroxy acid dehydrogenase YdfG
LNPPPVIGPDIILARGRNSRRTNNTAMINTTMMIPMADWGAYAASKFALTAYASVLRAEEHAAGVRVTSIFPGRTDTDMQRGVRAAEAGAYEPDRYLRPASVAAAILFAVNAPRDATVPELVIGPAG